MTGEEITMEEARKRFLDASNKMASALEDLAGMEAVIEQFQDTDCNTGVGLKDAVGMVQKGFLTISSFPLEYLGGWDEILFESAMMKFGRKEKDEN